jgi:hypothetical protein
LNGEMAARPIARDRGVLAHFVYSYIAADFDFGVAAFLFQHRGNVARGSVAKELAKLFLVIRDAMFFHQSQEIRRSITGERRLGEVTIMRKKIIRGGVQVGEVAAAAAGDQNLPADSIRALQHEDTPTALAGFDGTHQAGGTSSENDDVEFLIHAGKSLAG